MHPAVTFALLAYNQEKYVREAIEGAFAQRFEALEIILSDDGSSDRTFAIMQEMAAAYDGPHAVKVRQEQPNVGPIRHLINAARCGRGEFLVGAAGDDISHPDRTAALHSAWKATGAAALSSWHDEIDEAGNVLRRDLSFQPSAVTQTLFRRSPVALRPGGVVQAVPGFCAAYPRSFWADMPDPAERLFVEDGLATILINLRGESIVRVPRSLVAYRLLDNSLSNRNCGLTEAEITKREDGIDFLARDQAAMVDHLYAVAEWQGLTIDPPTRAQIDRYGNHGRLIASFWNSRRIARLRRLAKVRTREDAAFLLPRLAGRRAFINLRILAAKLRSFRLKG